MLYEIDELDRSGVVLSLTPSEQRALRRVVDWLGSEWSASGTVRVYSRGYVGIVALSPRTIIRVTTKLPVVNVLALASLAFQTLPIPTSVGDALLDTAEPVLDWLSVLLITELEQLLAHGLRQNYILTDDELPYVRGRLRFDRIAACSHPGLALYEFADFLPDTPENRLLRSALEVLANRRLLPGLRQRVDQLVRGFHGVSLVRPTAQLVAGCQITRLNQHYRSALELSRLLIEQSGVEAEAGEILAPAYFFPMERVFELAITNLLRNRLPNVRRQTGRSYKPIAGFPETSLSFTADIVVGAPPQLVVDTKYALPEMRNQYDGWSLHNQHIYQVAFYALSLGCPALLVYPRVNRDLDITFDIEAIQVSILTVELEAPGLAGLDKLVARVASLVNSYVAA